MGRATPIHTIKSDSRFLSGWFDTAAGIALAEVPSESAHIASSLLTKYKTLRSMTRKLFARLSAEDHMVQTCADAIPVKWHRASTTWLFKTACQARQPITNPSGPNNESCQFHHRNRRCFLGPRP